MKDILIKYRFEIIVSSLVVLIIGMSATLAYQILGRDTNSLEPTTITKDPSISNVCSENWTCESWSRCADDGTQTRECRDLNTCGTETIKPRTTQSCEPFVFVEPTLGPFDIEIRGDDRCQADISDALSLLEEKAPEYYTDVRKYVGVIECINSNRSTVYFESPPRVEIAVSRPISTIEMISSTIVHEMLHSKLYHEYLLENRPYLYNVPRCVHGGLEKEIEISMEQIKVLKQIGSSQFDIYTQQSLIDNPPDVWKNVRCDE